MVRVTRWKRYWLYGELDQGSAEDSVKVRVVTGHEKHIMDDLPISESRPRLVPEEVRCGGC